MGLQEDLNRFNKQQEKCQSMLSNIAAKSASSNKPAPAAKHTSAPVKFSNEIQRLQLLYNIRKASVQAQMKRVIDILFQTRQAFTSEQIKETCYVDVNANKEVFEQLRKNIKVNYNGQYFSYKAKHDVKDKKELLVLIRKYINGIDVTDLKDAYPNVMEELQALKAAGQIWLVSKFGCHDIAFPNDTTLCIKVDDDLKQLFRSIELSQDMLDIEKDLRKSGMKPATNTTKRRAVPQVQGLYSNAKPRRKNRGFSKRTKLTNAHLPELFQISKNT